MPPYDVIGPELADALRRRRSNAVFLELPQGTPPAKYARAAALWRRWTVDGTLARDPKPAFYAIEERYRLSGETRVRRGILSALGATPKAAEAIIPHERTLAKPKVDRLKMLDAVGVNSSPIFGVFADPSGAARRAIAAGMKGRPDAAGQSHAKCGLSALGRGRTGAHRRDPRGPVAALDFDRRWAPPLLRKPRPSCQDERAGHRRRAGLPCCRRGPGFGRFAHAPHRRKKFVEARKRAHSP